MIETAILVKSARRCALCFFLNGDLAEKHGQIAHLDKNPSNAAEDNLAFMCLQHHSLYDSKTSQHKNYTISEVKSARSQLYALVATGNHILPVEPKPSIEADKATLADLLTVLPSNGCIRFLREKDFGWSFNLKDLNEAHAFLEQRNGPDHEFLDPALERARKRLRQTLQTFLTNLAFNTWPNGDRQSVDHDLEMTDRSLYYSTIEKLNRESTDVCKAYDSLVKAARKKLGV